MITKSQIKLIASLQHKKFRKEHGLFIAEGAKVVSELLDSDFSVREVYATETFYEKQGDDLTENDKKTRIEIIKEDEFAKISALTTPQQILAVAEIPRNVFELTNLENKLTLVLDDIHDPGNVGTIIRIADWFGIENIICSETTADAFSPKVVQASMGSVFRVKIFYEDLEKFLSKNKSSLKIPVYGTVLNGENIFDANLSSEGFILTGNESKGLSDSLQQFLTKRLTIPSFSKSPKKIDSLNAAMATAIVCTEFRKR